MDVTPYISARSASSITLCPRKTKIRDAIFSIGFTSVQRYLSCASFNAAATIGFARNGDRGFVKLLSVQLEKL
jgi:hypothetical protein